MGGLLATTSDGGTSPPIADAALEFPFYDINGDQEVTRDELFTVLNRLDMKWTREKSNTLFNAIDSNRDNRICLKEFTAWVFKEQSIAKKTSSPCPAATLPSDPKVALPRPLNNTKLASPRPEKSTKLSSPRPENSTKLASPRPEKRNADFVAKLASPRPETSTKVASPRPENATKVASPRPETNAFEDLSSTWFDRIPVEQLPRRIADAVLQVAYVAGVWAVARSKGDEAERRMANRLALCHVELSKDNKMSPGTLTQLQDLAQSCSLLMVAEARGDKQEEEHSMQRIKKCLKPKPHEFTKSLWHNLFNLFHTAGRFACAVEAGDRQMRDQEQDNFRELATAIAAGVKYNRGDIQEKIISWDNSASGQAFAAR